MLKGDQRTGLLAQAHVMPRELRVEVLLINGHELAAAENLADEPCSQEKSATAVESDSD